jgi:hypothetical protein
MTIAVAQACILTEGITEPAPFADPLPSDLAAMTPCSTDAIRAGLPDPGGSGLSDLRWCLRERMA